MIIPSVIHKQPDGSERQFDIYSRLLSENLVFLNGPVTDESAAVVIAQLMHLNAKHKSAEIMFYINSPGGSVTAGLGIIDAMNMISNRTQTIVIGQACSMGAVLLANGAKGKRFAMENSRIMIHQPSGGVQGTAAVMENNLEEMTRLKDILYRILADKTGQTLEKVAEDCKTDYFLSPEDALEYGLIDEIIKEKK